MDARELALIWGLSTAPFLFPALGVLLVSAREINGVRIAVGLAMPLWLLLLADPYMPHDCNGEGADAVFLVVPLGLLSGLCRLAAGPLLQGIAKPRC